MDCNWLPLVLALEWQQIALFLSLLLTLAHALEEVWGDGGPLWAYFGEIAGTKVSPWIGGALVLVFLPALLATFAALGYGGGCATALSLLAGAKLGDAVFSHAVPDLFARQPNPGIYSALLAACEAGLVIGLLDVQWLPAIAAGTVFALVLPVLWLLGRFGR